MPRPVSPPRPPHRARRSAAGHSSADHARRHRRQSPVIDTVFLAGPISYHRLLIQAVGRALRRHEGKSEVVVHDYVDAAVPVLNAQYSKRRSAYRHMGFTD